MPQSHLSKPTLSRLSPAKINLFLHITSKRKDGYHNLQTVFRLLNWGDYLHFSPTENLKVSQLLITNTNSDRQATAMCKTLISITGASNITVSLADNLIFKAAKSLLSYVIDSNKLPVYLQKISIRLDKRLPMGAGLGGGSSNAAITLLSLNELWQLNLSQEELISIATTIGADVPIFIFGQDAIAMGIGEELTAIDLPDQHYLILTPDAHVSTAKLFTHPKLRRDIECLSVATIKNQSDSYVQQLDSPYHNVFTPVVTRLAPAVDNALQYLQGLEDQASGVARMTGSGSAVFLPLDNRIVHDKTLLNKWINDAPCPAYVVSSL